MFLPTCVHEISSRFRQERSVLNCRWGFSQYRVKVTCLQIKIFVMVEEIFSDMCKKNALLVVLCGLGLVCDEGELCEKKI